MNEADVLSRIEFGVASWAFDFGGLLESVFVLVFREYSGEAHRLVGYLGLLHHELQRDVVDGLLVHNAVVFKNGYTFLFVKRPFVFVSDAKLRHKKKAASRMIQSLDLRQAATRRNKRRPVFRQVLR